MSSRCTRGVGNSNSNSNEWKAVETYTITVETKDKSNTTNLDPDGCTFTEATGVYSATVDNINGVVNVVLARNTNENNTNTANFVLQDERPRPWMELSSSPRVAKPLTQWTPTMALSSWFTSEDGTKSRQFTVKATYLDALKSVTITGMDGEKYTGTPVDTDYNNIPDHYHGDPACGRYFPIPTVNLRIPVSLAVSYEAEGPQQPGCHWYQ